MFAVVCILLRVVAVIGHYSGFSMFYASNISAPAEVQRMREFVPWFKRLRPWLLTTTKDTNLWHKTVTHDRISTRTEHPKQNRAAPDTHISGAANCGYLRSVISPIHRAKSAERISWAARRSAS